MSRIPAVLHRPIRTFVIAFAGIALPGALGWLNALTEWARAEGQTPFPDARSLAFAGVAAIVAGSIALLNLGVVALENATGKALLRQPTGTDEVQVHGDGSFTVPAGHRGPLPALIESAYDEDPVDLPADEHWDGEGAEPDFDHPADNRT